MDVEQDLGFFAPMEDGVQAIIDGSVEMEEQAATAEAVKEEPKPTNKPPPPPKKPAPPANVSTPTLQEIEADKVTEMAELYWNLAEGQEVEFEARVVEDIWYEHLVKSNFSLRKVMLLEFSQYLEKYLWPFFVGTGEQKSSKIHVVSIVLMVNEKFRERVPGVWTIFEQEPVKFSALFNRVTKLLLESEDSERFPLNVRRYLLIFLIHCFQSLENPTIRNKCIALVKISSWFCLTDVRRELEVARLDTKRKALWEDLKQKWEDKKAKSEARQGEKEKKKAKGKGKGKVKAKEEEEEEEKEESTKLELPSDYTFMSDLIKSFFRVLRSIPASGPPPENSVAFCERFLELLIDLENQWPTRRCFHALVQDHLVVQICERSELARRGREYNEKNRGISLALPTDWGSKGSESGALFVQLLENLKFFVGFEIDDVTGQALSAEAMANRHYERIRRIQKLAFVKFKDELEDFAMANVGNIETRESLRWHLDRASDAVIWGLCTELGIRTKGFWPKKPKKHGKKIVGKSSKKAQQPKASEDVEMGEASENVEMAKPLEEFDREFLIELLLTTFEKRRSQIDTINALPLYPDENFLFDETVVPATTAFANTHCLAIPKLNFQFLTIHDYLLRNFNLFRLESTFEIRQDVEDVVKRLAPQYNLDHRSGIDKTIFTGWARMALPIDRFEIVDVSPPRLGENKPAFVKADVTFSIHNYTDSIKQEWEALRPHDVLFLLSIQVEPEESALKPKRNESEGASFRRKYGLKSVRGCEVLTPIGDDGLPVDDLTAAQQVTASHSYGQNVEKPRVTGNSRTFRVLLDTNQYKLDLDRMAKKESPDVYETFNVLMRRKPQENNFRAVLETIRDLMQSDLIVPQWLEHVFLGYGQRDSAHFTKMKNPVRTIDFRDTFLDWEHLRESFPNHSVVAAPSKNGGEEGVSPPYVLTFPQSLFSGKEDEKEDEKEDAKGKKPAPSAAVAGTKRKFGEDLAEDGPTGESIVARTYKLPNMGPYPEDLPKKNTIRFTPAQVEAIHAGTSPGLTLIVGPPGTGKTDVAVQIIANIYHNFPQQHTLLITHSNQALNQLFEKIVALDIDSRHILRLGRGMDDLDLENAGDWGKYGRVDAFLETRMKLLAEVDRLAKSLDVPGEHGHTCETAGYFYLYHVLSRWEPYIHRVKSEHASRAHVVDAFPFHAFFENAPQPLFPNDASYESALEIAEGCFRHLKNIFDQLEELRAFELLRNRRDRSNYMLTKEARIIALTCTHAALKRRELVQLGFKYDNVVMEEAAQILEVETFIPLLLQSPDPDTGASRLKRVVMIGDHNQLPPVVKNQAFQRYGNMEQSMFARFIRLGVPYVELDRQGRCRSSLAELFRWRYKNVRDLELVQQRPEFKRANPGFAFEYQVINVPEFQGQGESEPRPHFVQNLGEAEYVVATYQYMRLLGYPASKISILATYNGQVELIRDVLERRCSWNPLFGNPAHVSTVDKFQGNQNDYVLLSLVRTKTFGHLRDVRRLLVAMSRARLGLYIFCKAKLFNNCYELKPVFSQLLSRPYSNLWVVSGETADSPEFNRNVSETLVRKDPKGKWVGICEVGNKKVKAEPIDGVAHMGAFVAQMVREHIAWRKAQREGKELHKPITRVRPKIKRTRAKVKEAEDALRVGTHPEDVAQGLLGYEFVSGFVAATDLYARVIDALAFFANPSKGNSERTILTLGDSEEGQVHIDVVPDDYNFDVKEEGDEGAGRVGFGPMCF